MVLPTGEVIPGEQRQVWEEATRAQGRREETERSRTEMDRGCVEVRDCRREYLLNYFGEGLEDPCGYCDNCEAGSVVENAGDEPFPANSRIVRGEWGEGLLQRYEGGKMVVLRRGRVQDLERVLLEKAGKRAACRWVTVRLAYFGPFTLLVKSLSHAGPRRRLELYERE